MPAGVLGALVLDAVEGGRQLREGGILHRNISLHRSVWEGGVEDTKTV